MKRSEWLKGKRLKTSLSIKFTKEKIDEKMQHEDVWNRIISEQGLFEESAREGPRVSIQVFPAENYLSTSEMTEAYSETHISEQAIRQGMTVRAYLDSTRERSDEETLIILQRGDLERLNTTRGHQMLHGILHEA